MIKETHEQNFFLKQREFLKVEGNDSILALFASNLDLSKDVNSYKSIYSLYSRQYQVPFSLPVDEKDLENAMNEAHQSYLDWKLMQNKILEHVTNY